MITVKPGAQLSILRKEIYSCFPAFEKAYSEVNAQCIISCGTDGHKKTDPHPNGYAIDLSTWPIKTEAQKLQVANRIKELIGFEYYVKYEPNEFDANGKPTKHEHIHVQIRKDLWPKYLEAENGK